MPTDTQSELSPLPQGASRLRDSLHDARNHSDALFRILTPEGLYERAVAERHRFIFYLGHLEAFDWNLLARYHLKLPAFRPQWDDLFAFGIDPAQDALPIDRAEDWPPEQEVRHYCSTVRNTIDAHLEQLPDTLLHVAIEHRLMHLETLCYLMHNLAGAHKQGQDEQAETVGEPPENQWIRIPAGTVTMGQSLDEFGWDNEYPSHQRNVASFTISKFKVTNGEYLRFVEAGGPVPHFWNRGSGSWRLRRMFSEIPLPLDWPVYVSHAQASAYANWAGLRLPSEAEFHQAAYGSSDGRERQYPWGDTPPEALHGNFGLAQWNPARVDAHPAGDSAFGVSQLVGNGWEWTHSLFAPFPGFTAFPFYPGYSADFFDHQHYVLKGASSRTAKPLLRRSFRNWFRPEYPYAFASFRCVSGAA